MPDYICTLIMAEIIEEQVLLKLLHLLLQVPTSVKIKIKTVIKMHSNIPINILNKFKIFE